MTALLLRYCQKIIFLCDSVGFCGEISLEY